MKIALMIAKLLRAVPEEEKKRLKLLTWIGDIFVSHLDDGDGQIAHQEGQENGQHHLGDPPLVPPGLQFPGVPGPGCGHRAADSSNSSTRGGQLGCLVVLPHPGFRTTIKIFLKIMYYSLVHTFIRAL